MPGSLSTDSKATARIAVLRQDLIEIATASPPALTAQKISSAVGAAEGTVETLLAWADTRPQ